MGNEDFDEVIKILGMMARSVQKKRFYIVNAFISECYIYLLLACQQEPLPPYRKKNSLSPFLSGEGVVHRLVIS